MTTADQHKNFAYSTIATAPSPTTTGTSLTVAADNFPSVPFNATIWPSGKQPTFKNSEIVRVTNKAGTTFTITRAQEGTTARNIIGSSPGPADQIAATITAKTLTDAENYASNYSPYILSSGANSGLQTLATNTSLTGTNWEYIFPVTVSQNVAFNQILLLNSLSYSTSATGPATNSYYSLYGLYSMNANTLSLITSSSFSIGETWNSGFLTWNFPTSTATSGYGYGGFLAGNLTRTNEITGSYIHGLRIVGLQFGTNIQLNPDVYYIGILSLRSTATAGAVTMVGLSNAGIGGLIIQTINQPGTGSATSAAPVLPLGSLNANWGVNGGVGGTTSNNSNITQWWGRHIVGFVTSAGTNSILNAIQLGSLAQTGAGLTGTILPTVTFVST